MTAQDEGRLFKELLDLGELLQSAEASAGKALEQVALLRKHHRAKLAEWHEARGDDKEEPVESHEPETAAPAAEALLGAVSGAIRRAEDASEARIAVLSIERPGRGARISSTDAGGDDTIEDREDGATRPPSDISRNESGPREDGRSDA